MPFLEVPIKYLHECLTYDADTGDLRWKPQISKARSARYAGKVKNARYAGKLAGTPGTHGYLIICVTYEGKPHLLKAHRVAFAMTHGRWPGKLDHRNRITSDNRIVNLREVTHAQNMQNMEGCGFKPYSNGYRARIVVNGREKHLGCFRTKEEARRVYLAAKEQYHPFYSQIGG
jgi:hypothetical protein